MLTCADESHFEVFVSKMAGIARRLIDKRAGVFPIAFSFGYSSILVFIYVATGVIFVLSPGIRAHFGISDSPSVI